MTIPLLTVEEARKRGLDAGIQEQMAGINAFRALLQNTVAAGPAAKLLTTLLFNGKVDARWRELVILRTGWLTRSEYEFCQHVGVAKRLNIPEADILGVRDPASHDGYSDIDRAVIAMADQLHQNAQVSATTWKILERAFSPEQLVELVLIAGNWRMLAGFFNSAKVPLDSQVPSWPEGKAP
jgi:alkylhydroperoxidase family enzyme